MLFPSGFLWLIYLRSSQTDKIPSMGSLSKCPQQLEPSPAASQAACYQKLESGTEMQLKFSHSRMGYGYPE